MITVLIRPGSIKYWLCHSQRLCNAWRWHSA